MSSRKDRLWKRYLLHYRKPEKQGAGSKQGPSWQPGTQPQSCHTGHLGGHSGNSTASPGPRTVLWAPCLRGVLGNRTFVPPLQPSPERKPGLAFVCVCVCPRPDSKVQAAASDQWSQVTHHPSCQGRAGSRASGHFVSRSARWALRPALEVVVGLCRVVPESKVRW